MTDPIIWLGLWALLLWGVGNLRGNILVRRHWKIVCFPGLALEGFIRSLACLITGTPIEKWSPLEDGRPFLKTGVCPVQRIGVPIAMMIRLFLTVLFVFILLSFTHPEYLERGPRLPSLLSHSGIDTTVGQYFRSLGELPRLLGLDSLTGLIVLWVVFTTALATGLSQREFFAAIWAWLAIIVLAYLSEWLGVKFKFLGRGWFIDRWYLPGAYRSFSLLVTVSAVALASVMSLHLLPGITARMKPKPSHAPEGLHPDHH